MAAWSLGMVGGGSEVRGIVRFVCFEEKLDLDRVVGCLEDRRKERLGRPRPDPILVRHIGPVAVWGAVGGSGAGHGGSSRHPGRRVGVGCRVKP